MEVERINERLNSLRHMEYSKEVGDEIEKLERMKSMKDVVFVSVAFGHEYLKQMDRLQKSILRIYPEANLLFFDNGLPTGSQSFYDSLYGFKPHAIQEARNQGYKKVIWLDPAMILVDKIDELIARETIVAVKDESLLHNVVSDRCYKYFGFTRDFVKAKNWHLVGGSLYFFNFEHPYTNIVFDQWLKAEKDGIFGSQWDAASDKLQGHRYDEAVMALCMYTNNIKPVTHADVRYCNGESPMWLKKHFK
jgi:hypothetical protein